MPKPKDKARFMKFVNKTGQIMGHLKKPCWEWTGTVDRYGRPRFRLDHENHLARRAALLLEPGSMLRLILSTSISKTC